MMVTVDSVAHTALPVANAAVAGHYGFRGSLDISQRTKMTIRQAAQLLPTIVAEAPDGASLRVRNTEEWLTAFAEWDATSEARSIVQRDIIFRNVREQLEYVARREIAQRFRHAKKIALSRTTGQLEPASPSSGVPRSAGGGGKGLLATARRAAASGTPSSVDDEQSRQAAAKAAATLEKLAVDRVTDLWELCRWPSLGPRIFRELVPPAVALLRDPPSAKMAAMVSGVLLMLTSPSRDCARTLGLRCFDGVKPDYAGRHRDKETRLVNPATPLFEVLLEAIIGLARLAWHREQDEDIVTSTHRQTRGSADENGGGPEIAVTLTDAKGAVVAEAPPPEKTTLRHAELRLLAVGARRCVELAARVLEDDEARQAAHESSSHKGALVVHMLSCALALSAWIVHAEDFATDDAEKVPATAEGNQSLKATPFVDAVHIHDEPDADETPEVDLAGSVETEMAYSLEIGVGALFRELRRGPAVVCAALSQESSHGKRGKAVPVARHPRFFDWVVPALQAAEEVSDESRTVRTQLGAVMARVAMRPASRSATADAIEPIRRSVKLSPLCGLFTLWAAIQCHRERIAERAEASGGANDDMLPQWESVCATAAPLATRSFVGPHARALALLSVGCLCGVAYHDGTSGESAKVVLDAGAIDTALTIIQRWKDDRIRQVGVSLLAACLAHANDSQLRAALQPKSGVGVWRVVIDVTADALAVADAVVHRGTKGTAGQSESRVAHQHGIASTLRAAASCIMNLCAVKQRLGVDDDDADVVTPEDLGVIGRLLKVGVDIVFPTAISVMLLSINHDNHYNLSSNGTVETLVGWNALLVLSLREAVGSAWAEDSQADSARCEAEIRSLQDSAQSVSLALWLLLRDGPGAQAALDAGAVPVLADLAATCLDGCCPAAVHVLVLRALHALLCGSSYADSSIAMQALEEYVAVGGVTLVQRAMLNDSEDGAVRLHAAELLPLLNPYRLEGDGSLQGAWAGSFAADVVSLLSADHLPDVKRLGTRFLAPLSSNEDALAALIEAGAVAAVMDALEVLVFKTLDPELSEQAELVSEMQRTRLSACQSIEDGDGFVEEGGDATPGFVDIHKCVQTLVNLSTVPKCQVDIADHGLEMLVFLVRADVPDKTRDVTQRLLDNLCRNPGNKDRFIRCEIAMSRPIPRKQTVEPRLTPREEFDADGPFAPHSKDYCTWLDRKFGPSTGKHNKAGRHPQGSARGRPATAPNRRRRPSTSGGRDSVPPWSSTRHTGGPADTLSGSARLTQRLRIPDDGVAEKWLAAAAALRIGRRFRLPVTRTMSRKRDWLWNESKAIEAERKRARAAAARKRQRLREQRTHKRRKAELAKWLKQREQARRNRVERAARAGHHAAATGNGSSGPKVKSEIAGRKTAIPTLIRQGTVRKLETKWKVAGSKALLAGKLRLALGDGNSSPATAARAAQNARTASGTGMRAVRRRLSQGIELEQESVCAEANPHRNPWNVEVQRLAPLANGGSDGAVLTDVDVSKEDGAEPAAAKEGKRRRQRPHSAHPAAGRMPVAHRLMISPSRKRHVSVFGAPPKLGADEPGARNASDRPSTAPSSRAAEPGHRSAASLGKSMKSRAPGPADLTPTMRAPTGTEVASAEWVHVPVPGASARVCDGIPHHKLPDGRLVHVFARDPLHELTIAYPPVQPSFPCSVEDGGFTELPVPTHAPVPLAADLSVVALSALDPAPLGPTWPTQPLAAVPDFDTPCRFTLILPPRVAEIALHKTHQRWAVDSPDSMFRTRKDDCDSKSYFEDEEYIARLFAHDWSTLRAKRSFDKFIRYWCLKNDTQIESIRSIMSKYYGLLLSAFDYMATYDDAISTFVVKLPEWRAWLELCEAVEGDGGLEGAGVGVAVVEAALKDSIAVDRKARSGATNAMAKAYSGLTRATLVEAVIRLAQRKWVRRRQKGALNAALDRLMTAHLSRYGDLQLFHDRDDFRRTHVYTFKVNENLRGCQELLRKIFLHSCRTIRGVGGASSRMDFPDWMSLMSAYDLLDKSFTEKEATLAFKWSRMRCLDPERRAYRENRISFVDFCEALVRVAALKWMPSPEQVMYSEAEDLVAYFRAGLHHEADHSVDAIGASATPRPLDAKVYILLQLISDKGEGPSRRNATGTLK